MAGWISSKLKVAENLLQQIDEQAAESLGKEERKQSDEWEIATPRTPPTGSVSLRDQLKKKAMTLEKKERVGNFNGDHIHSSGKEKWEPSFKSSDDTVKDSDWTELLSTPKRNGAQSAGRKGGGNAGKLVGGRKRRGDGSANKKSYSKAGVSGEKVIEGLESVQGSRVMGNSEGSKEAEHGGFALANGKPVGAVAKNDDSLYDGHTPHLQSEGGKEAVIDHGEIGRATTVTLNCDGDVAVGGLKSGSNSASVGESVSDSDSGSDSSPSSDSEVERELQKRIQRRRQILAAKAAAKAMETINEQENVVARLEGEKQSLEKILEERAKQAVEEASELQSTMMEVMEAAELEKQKHNLTRMELLARLAKLETSNADLAKALAAAQWNLEIEVNDVADLRQQVDVKEVVYEELKKTSFCTHQKRTSRNSLTPLKGFELEKEMLDAEYSFIVDKSARLKEKIMNLEVDTDSTVRELENSTEVEIELKRRLCQMTDHLIKKQAQVEALSSDKAMIHFRIEAVSRLLDENKSLTNEGDISSSLRDDLETGTWEMSSSKLHPVLKRKIQSGRLHLGSLLRQLDILSLSGAVFLSRKPAAKLWSVVYPVCLHLWVLYILFSHSQTTGSSISKTVVSFEHINNSIGV